MPSTGTGDLAPQYVSDSGTADNYVITTGQYTGYFPGMSFLMEVGNDNTGQSFLDVNGIGQQEIKNTDLSSLSGGQLISGQLAYVVFRGSDFQLINTINAPALTAVSMQVIDTTGTYTPTAGTKFVGMKAIGAGGGGGGAAATAANQVAAAQGGGGGGYAEAIFPIASIVGTAAITIGAAGTAGVAGNNDGGNGGTTTVVANNGAGAPLLQATGGSGGSGSAANTINVFSGNGGQGGTGTLGTVNLMGNNGFYGLSLPGPGVTLAGAGGNGGASALGAGGGTGQASTGAGAAATNHGGGGSGACSVTDNTNRAGGAGFKGAVYIIEYI